MGVLGNAGLKVIYIQLQDLADRHRSLHEHHDFLKGFIIVSTIYSSSS